MEKITIENYKNSISRPLEASEEGFVYLNKDEEEFLNKIKIAEVLHKSNNYVQVYILKQLQTALDVLLNFRSAAVISKKNIYSFAAGKGFLKPIRCSDVLFKCHEIFPSEMRKNFTATNLRKQAATVAQLLNLGTEDINDWAHHMGHTTEVHKRHYRIRENPNAILKTGKILNMLDQGTLGKHKGKKLRDINIDLGKV